MYAIDLPANFHEELMRIAREMHNEKYPEDQVEQSLVNDTYNTLNEGHLSGRNIKLGDAAGVDPAVMKMQQNIYRFSHAKTAVQEAEINSLLYEDGKKRSWEEFKAEVEKVNSKYNKNYLQAEYQTAVQAGHHARNWEQFQSQKKLFPNLKYKTVGDSRVREEHEHMEGIIAPIDSDFWKKYYPPNGWRCRCRVVQTAELANHDLPEDIKGVSPEFRNNVGISSEVYSEGKEPGSKPQKYFVLAKQLGGKKLEKAFELSKPFAPYNKVKTKKGKTVGVSPFASDSSDFKDNLKSALVAADSIKNLEINIRAHLDPNIAVGIKQPELEINGRLGDRKAIKGYRGIHTSFDDLSDKKADSVLFDLKDFPDWKPDMFVRKLKGKLMAQKKRWVKDIIVEYDGKATIFTGDDALNEPMKAIDLLKTLKAD